MLEAEKYIVHPAFGLRFRSQMAGFPMRAIRENGQAYDVEVVVEPVPPALPHPVYQSQIYTAAPGQLLCQTRTIADFFVANGSRVSIAPKPTIDPLKLCNLLFGGVTGGVLIQRGILALHGCSIETPTGVVVVCGHSGAGKSTLTALMLAQGFRILDDNIAALTPKSNQFLVAPGLGFLRLTEPTLKLLHWSPPDLSYPVPNQLKYIYQLPPTGFCDQLRPLRQIWLLDRACEQLTTPILGKAKLETLRQFTYMTELVRGLGQIEHFFPQWINIANSIPISIIGYPKTLTLPAWVDHLANLLHKA
ncbi:hypothetical protein RIF25_12425 [Thermosynechococcaceae cyanobacterium BACA0444]|uniref:HPr kinase n=1 Tax=Pseudocalidococcus azoricus BACA0444 TaxID=2918990 RepID=A0AAE4JX03_9CYAN|nr:hypothetical protein [Pseudocalidococcus azoricus]MDS3861611.1 hypothetical protein [Pseudocalidococcus azoricus BACA0444]